MMADRHDLHALAGAYALDAVTGPERDAFESHLSRCAACREEVRGLREATAKMSIASAVTPAPALREAVIAAARRARQLPPVLPAASAPGGPRHWLSWPARAGLAAAAVAAAVAIVLGALTHGAMQQLHRSQRQQHMIAAVLTAPDAVMLTSRVSTGGTATVVMSHRERALVFSASGLSALPASQSYELWVMGPGGTRPAGMLSVPSGGMAGPAVIPGLAAGDKIGLTVEPASGSSRPTSAPILVMVLSGH